MFYVQLWLLSSVLIFTTIHTIYSNLNFEIWSNYGFFAPQMIQW